MELSIKQALQQGIAAHKEGKFQEAERLYRAILKSKPLHPDANHNLGLLLASSNNFDAALPLFRTALETNPKVQQFWLSYINALIKEHQFDNARELIEQAKKQGVDLVSLNSLEKQFISNKQSSSIASSNPPQELLRDLLEHYQNGELRDAENQAKSIVKKFPQHEFAWTVLGSVFGQTDRKSEALAASQKAVELSPQNAEVHSNLGNALKELGRLDEAEVSYNQAIKLKPNNADAHSNLGVTLKELGRLDEAEASYKQAIKLNAGFVKAHFNLGNILKELGRFEEAEKSYKKAIALKPDYTLAYNNLGNALKELGRLNEAEASYNQAIALESNFVEALHNLSIAYSYMDNLETEIIQLQKILKIDLKDYGLRAGVSLGICSFLNGDFENSRKYLSKASEIQSKISPELKNEKVYWKYLSSILSWHEKNNINTHNQKIDKNLYVIGESHSLVTHQLIVQNSNYVSSCKARLIKGCKQWHLGNSKKNQYKYQFENIFNSLPKSSDVLLVFGEIDCRLNTGIIKYKNTSPKIEINEIIDDTVENYLNYIKKNNLTLNHNITIQGVPCPNINTKDCSKKEIQQLIEVIRNLNFELRKKSQEKGFEFLDMYKLTNRGDGLSNALWHIDNIHLSPDGFLEAWSKHIKG
jgi:tetratricopeptide (TPR) repeat protein